MICNDVPEWGIVGPKRLRDRVMVIATISMTFGMLPLLLCLSLRHIIVCY
jgi:hypothetical protein